MWEGRYPSPSFYVVVAPKFNQIYESPISKIYVWVKRIDLIQNPIKQREALAGPFNCFIGYVYSLSFTEQSHLSHNDLFWQLRGTWRSPHCLGWRFCITSKSLTSSCEHSRKNEMTKNDQKWNWAPTNALVFFVVVVVYIFWHPPDLFERRLRRPLAAAHG